MGKNRTSETNMVFVYLLFKEADIHIDLICFGRNFDHPHVNVVAPVPRKQSKNPPQFPLQNIAFCRKSLQYVSTVRFVLTFYSKKPCFLIKINCCTFAKNILFDCFVPPPPSIFEKSQIFKMTPKVWENRANNGITLLFLSKPQDKHGITLVHITYPLLLGFVSLVQSFKICLLKYKPIWY